SVLVPATARRLEGFVLEHLRQRPGVRSVLLCCGSIAWTNAAGRNSLCHLRDTLSTMGVNMVLSEPGSGLGQAFLGPGPSRAACQDGAVYTAEEDAIAALAQPSGTRLVP